VVISLNEVFNKRKNIPEVENIQDIVEMTLMKEDYLESAKAYIIYRKEHQRIREERKRFSTDGRHNYT